MLISNSILGDQALYYAIALILLLICLFWIAKKYPRWRTPFVILSIVCNLMDLLTKSPHNPIYGIMIA